MGFFKLSANQSLTETLYRLYNSKRNNMTSTRIRQIQEQTAYPDSLSVQQALLKVWNECCKQEQEQDKRYSEEDMIEFALFLDIHLPMKPRKTHRQLLEQFKKK